MLCNKFSIVKYCCNKFSIVKYYCNKFSIVNYYCNNILISDFLSLSLSLQIKCTFKIVQYIFWLIQLDTYFPNWLHESHEDTWLQWQLLLYLNTGCWCLIDRLRTKLYSSKNKDPKNGFLRFISHMSLKILKNPFLRDSTQIRTTPKTK